MKHAAIPARRLFTSFEMHASSNEDDDTPDDTEHFDDWHDQQPAHQPNQQQRTENL